MLSDPQLHYLDNAATTKPDGEAVEKAGVYLNEKNKAMITEVFTQVSINGINKTITRANLKKMYQKYCEQK